MDTQDLRRNNLGVSRVNVPRFDIEFRATDSTTGATHKDYTGNASVRFPDVVLGFTADEQEELFDAMVQVIIQILSRR